MYDSKNTASTEDSLINMKGTSPKWGNYRKDSDLVRKKASRKRKTPPKPSVEDSQPEPQVYNYFFH